MRKIRIVSSGKPHMTQITDVATGEAIEGATSVKVEITSGKRMCTLEFINSELEGEFLAPGCGEGLRRIAVERKRQRDVEGYGEKHDAQHEAGELYMAAAYYCVHASCMTDATDCAPVLWDQKSLKRAGFPTPTIRDLEKAGALIAAEIDRRLRLLESGEVF